MFQNINLRRALFEKTVCCIFLMTLLISICNAFAQQDIPSSQQIKGGHAASLASTAGFRTIAFYAEYDDISPTPAQIDWSAFNRVIIFGCAINTSTAPYLREAGNVSPSDSANFDGGYNKKIPWAQAIVDSMHAHGGLVYASMNVGSVFGIDITPVTGNVAERHVFESYLAGKGGWLQRRHIDGVWWDYEYPTNNDTGFKQMVIELNDTMATWGTPYIQGVDVPNYWEPVFGDTAWANNQFNDIDIMSYGFDDGSTVVGFNSPLYQDFTLYPNYNGTSWFGDTKNSQGVYISWISHGIRKSVFGCILPFEMRSATGVSAPGQSGHASTFTYYSNVLTAIAAAPAGSTHY